MKNVAFGAFVLSASLAMTASGQVKSVAAANNQPSSRTVTGNPTTSQRSSNGTRARVLVPGPTVVPVTGSIVSSGSLPAHAQPDFNNHTAASRFRRAGTPPASSSALVDPSTNPASNAAPGNARTETSNLKSSTSAPALANAATGGSPTIAAASTQIYRVGVRDVLDIKLSEHDSKNSTLFTVLEDGAVEYPLAGSPIVVDGLTTSEIATLLRQRIKVFDNPTVTVTVRDYASHAVTVSGFVAAPGTKVLRREAMPLYTVLAESLILPEAARAIITRQGRAPIAVDLKDANLSAMLVIPGDAIKVSALPAAPTEFYFVGGEINSAGQKPFHAGLTLTQAVLASGGTSPSAGTKVRVSRQGVDGKLNTEEYNLRKIQTGKVPDPVLQNGDRIEVTSAN